MIIRLTFLTSLRKHIHFPQFTRFFSASPVRNGIRGIARIGFWTLLTGLIGINSILLFPAPTAAFVESIPQQYRHISALDRFFAALYHFTLSQSEVRTNILGISNPTEPDRSAQMRTQAEHDYLRWQFITKQYPDYRDGYVMLTVLALKLNKDTEARQHLTRIRQIDPNFEYYSALSGLIPSQ